MRFISLDCAIEELEFQRQKMNETIEYIKSLKGKEMESEDNIIEEIVNHADQYFYNLKHALEEHLTNYETPASFAKRLKIQEERLDMLIQERKIATITVIDPQQFLKADYKEFQEMLYLQKLL